MSNFKFNPAKDIPDQSGKVFFITGGTTGLGATSIGFLAAKNPEHIFFSGRNKARANDLIAKIAKTSSTKLTFIECDLSSLASVQSAAKTFLSQSTRLDVLMCNAGVMATPATLSKDGYEMQFATNHLGHALLTKLLLPTMQSTPSPDVRIVNLSSVAYRISTPSAGIEFSKLRTQGANYGSLLSFNKWACYSQSKLSNLLYTTQLAEHHPNITSVAVHPGFIKTTLHQNEGFMDRQVMSYLAAGKWLSTEEGAYNQVWAATTVKEGLVNGAYYEPVGVKTTPTNRQGKDMKLAKELWEYTGRELEKWV